MLTFVKHGKDTFNLFLAIDEKITDEVATNCSQLKLKKK